MTIPHLSSAPFRKACEALQIEPAHVIMQPHLSQYIHERLKFAEKEFIDYLYMTDHSYAGRFLELYEKVPEQQRKYLPLEAYCLAAKIPPMELLEIVVGVCVRVGANESAVIAAVNQPAIVAKTVEQALDPENFKERQLFHKATGFLPQPKGARTTVQVIQHQEQQQQQAAALAQAAADNTAAPAPEHTIRRFVDRFNEQRGSEPSQLPPPTIDIPAPAIDDDPDADGDDADADADAPDEIEVEERDGQ